MEQGYRLPCPVVATPELYDIMLSCWNSEPAERPTFETVQWRLEDYFYTEDGAAAEGYKDASEIAAQQQHGGEVSVSCPNEGGPVDNRVQRVV